MPKHPKQVEGVTVQPTGRKKMERDYDVSDVEVLFRRGHWRNWNEAIHWLETQGERDNELTPGEVLAMTEDLRKLKQEGTAFTADPHRVYELAHRYRARR
ncbi:MAG TPA: hypothetical protein VIN09_10955 [Chloroflexota bacterium]